MGYQFLDVVDIEFSLDINGIRYLSEKNSILENGLAPLSSAALFELAINALPFDYCNVDVCNEVQKKIGIGTTVWGIKKAKSNFLSELYFFYPDVISSHKFNNVVSSLNDFVKCDGVAIPDLGVYQCISIDLNAVRPDYLNIYYLDHEDSCGVIASSWDLNCSSGVMKKKNTYFAGLSRSGFSESGFSFDKSYASVVEVLARYFPCRVDEFLGFVRGLRFAGGNNCLNPPVGCALKDGAFGLYYMGLNISDFILFLEEMEFPESLIEKIRPHSFQLSHLKFDVGLDFGFNEKSIEILKSSFFGSL
jgi:hypothetical protein